MRASLQRILFLVQRILLVAIPLWAVLAAAQESTLVAPVTKQASAVLKHSSSTAEEKLPLSLWVESEGVIQPFATSAGFQRYLDFVEKYRFSDIYCQVYRGGRSWFPSTKADPTPYKEAQAQGFSPIGDSLTALDGSVKVHAWVNSLRVYRNPKAPLVERVGEQAILKDSWGNSLLKYTSEGLPPIASPDFQLGTYGLWLDPGVPEVRAHIVETIRELVREYPKLAGVHLDMVRFPLAMRRAGTKRKGRRAGFGYSKASLKAFYEFAGKTFPAEFDDALVNALEQGGAWSTWRSFQVTKLVIEIRKMMRKEAPEMLLSAAVLANQDRATKHAYQQWPFWVKHQIVDYVVPMNYTARDGRFGELNKDALRVVGDSPLDVGIGAWLLRKNSGHLSRQVIAAHKAGASGTTLFSYANLADPKGMKIMDLLKSDLTAFLKSNP